MVKRKKNKSKFKNKTITNEDKIEEKKRNFVIKNFDEQIYEPQTIRISKINLEE